MALTAKNEKNNLISFISKMVDSIKQESFYVCDVDDIIKRHRIWQKLFPRITPFYAVKCNDSIVVLETLISLGMNFDCASKLEMSKIISLGVDSNRIIFAHPTKVASHVKYAAKQQIKIMTFDNEMELYKVKDLYPDAQLLIRIRCNSENSDFKMDEKFGCDPETEAVHLLKVAKTLRIDVRGVTFHVGSGCHDAEAFRRAIVQSRVIFNRAKEIGFDFNLLDIGGGLIYKTIKDFSDVINQAIDEFFPDLSTEIIAEPGRYYVTSAFTLVCQIHSLKYDSEKEKFFYYITDGIYGTIKVDSGFNCPRPLHEKLNAKLYRSTFFGPTCSGLDVILEDVQFPQMSIGEWMIFENMGAYSLTVASNFNGFPLPRIYVIQGKFK